MPSLLPLAGAFSLGARTGRFRAEQSSVHLTLDAITAEEVTIFFDAVWNNAEEVSTGFLLDEVNNRHRIQAAKY